MLFLIYAIVVMLTSMYMMVASLNEKFNVMSAELHNKSQILAKQQRYPHLITPIIALSMAGIMTPVVAPYFVHQISDFEAISFQWVGLLASLVFGFMHLWRVKRYKSNMSIALVVVGITLVFMYGKSLSFVTSDKVGVLNYGLLSSMTPISDVDCESGMLLVDVGEKEAIWRCPQQVTILPMTSKPFIPWPSYTQGCSEELAAAIHQMMYEASQHSSSK